MEDKITPTENAPTKNPDIHKLDCLARLAPKKHKSLSALKNNNSYYRIEVRGKLQSMGASARTPKKKVLVVPREEKKTKEK